MRTKEEILEDMEKMSSQLVELKNELVDNITHTAHELFYERFNRLQLSLNCLNLEYDLYTKKELMNKPLR